MFDIALEPFPASRDDVLAVDGSSRHEASIEGLKCFRFLE
jgi:hypothetical protein